MCTGCAQCGSQGAGECTQYVVYTCSDLTCLIGFSRLRLHHQQPGAVEMVLSVMHACCSGTDERFWLILYLWECMCIVLMGSSAGI